MIISGYKHFGGRQVEAGALKNVLAHLGVVAPHTGQPFGDALLFGIGGGIGLGYFVYASASYTALFVATRITTEETRRPGFLQAMTERLFRAIGRADLIDNPRYRTNADRVRHAEELDAIIGEFIGLKTLAENMAYFDENEVTVGPIYDIAQIMEDPHVIAREMLVEYPDEDMGQVPMHGIVPKLSATPGAVRMPAPKLGEHNTEILSGLGFGAAEIERLAGAGVIYSGPQRRKRPE